MQENKTLWQAIWNYHEDAKKAKETRMRQNFDNWECFHMRQDWSHKAKGQSKEFLPKQSQIVEETTSFLQQGLMDVGQWFRIKRLDGVKPQDAIFEDFEIEKLLNRQLLKNNFIEHVGDALKMGQLQSLMITKIGGTMIDQIKFKSSEVSLSETKLIKEIKKVWQLKLYLIRAENWFPDPTGEGLFNQEMIEMDLHALIQIANASHVEEFDMEAIMSLTEDSDYEDERTRAVETNQDVVHTPSRKRVRIIEHWGSICDPYTGKLLHENVVCRITEDGKIISKPMKNPLWHGEDPYVVSPILRVPLSVWHKALTDGTTYLNRAINELFNLELDSGLMSVFGVRQLREDWLDNPDEVSDGIAPGQTLKVNNRCPPGAKALERVDTGSLSDEANHMYNVTAKELNDSSFSNDFRGGTVSQRAVKATEIVAANQAIQGVFNGIVKRLEQVYLGKILHKSWLTCAQHIDDMDNDEVKALLGEDRANFLSTISPAERFAKTALNHKFEVFGLSQVLNKIQDFKKITTLLQTIGTSETLINEFMRRYSISKLLGEIVKSLDISEEKIAIEPAEAAQIQKEKQAQMAMAMMKAQGTGKRNLEQGANVQSQIPQMSAMAEGEAPFNPANALGLTTPMG